MEVVMKEMRKNILILFVSTIGLLVFTGDLLSQQSPEELFEKALYMEEGQGDLGKAIDLYKQILKQFPENRKIAAQAQLHIGFCYEKLGEKEAQKAYESVIEKFPDQKEHVAVARARLTELTSTQPAQQTLTHIWTFGDDDLYLEAQSLSPDGTKLLGIHISFKYGQNVVYKDLNTGKFEFITKYDWDNEEDGWAYQPVWSQDGQQIAFNFANRRKEGISTEELRITSLKGKSKVLFKCKNEDEAVYPCNWFPDNNRILAVHITDSKVLRLGAVSRQNKGFELIYSIQMPKDLNIAVGGGGFMGFQLSPDGNHIVLRKLENGVSHLSIMDIATKTISPISDSPANDFRPIWSFDGKYLAFMSDRSGSADLWAMPMGKDGKPSGKAFLLRDSMDNATLLNWTASGFAYTNWVSMIDIYTMPVDPKTGAPAGEPQQLDFRPTGNNNSPVYSPDGKFIAFINRGEFRTRNIIIYPVRGGENRSFRIPSTSFRASLFDLRWRPDGRGISFTCRTTEESPGWKEGEIPRRFFLLDLDTEEWQTWPLDDIAGWTRTDWRGDGLGIYQTVRNSTGMGIVDRDLKTGGKRDVFNDAGGFSALRSSRDYTKLAFATRRFSGDAVIIDPRTGKKQKVFNDFSRPVWSPDGKSIIALKDNALAYHVISYSDGSSQKYDLSKNLLKGEIVFLDWSPLGDQVVFDFRFRKADSYIIRNVLTSDKN